jgi:hypothetical protein
MESYPQEDIEASLSDEALQREHPLDQESPEMRRELHNLRVQARRRGAGEATVWIYFSSPDRTWEHLCGRAGWLLYDPKSKRQYDFIETVMS